MNNILITGANSGIGEALFESLDLGQYENIIVLDKEKVSIDQKGIYSFKCDVSKKDEVAKIFKKLRSKGILISRAVNAAGVPGPNKPFLRSTIEEMQEVININFNSTMIMMHELLKDMEELGEGKIVNIASVLARCGMAGSSSYSASKAAIVALSRTLAIEYADKNIQINTISPGAVDTNFLNLLKKRIGTDALSSIHPVKRIATAEEVACYIRFILEKETSFMTGVDIPIDGGYSAQ